MTRVHRFDYVKLIFKVDAEMMQDDITPKVRSLLQNAKRHVPDCKDTWREHVIGAALNQRAYCFDVWGDLADYFLAELPASMWGNIYRADLRLTDDEITESRIQALQGYVMALPPKNISYNTFTTPGATKTDKRDVGGKGIRVGSRKSDHHLVVYKRRGGPGCIEYRLQGKACQTITRDLQQSEAYPNSYDRYDALFALMMGRMSKMLDNGFGAPTCVQLMNLADSCTQQLNPAEALYEASEMADADAWAEGLSEEEQVSWQQSTFLPTAKGWKD